MLFVNLFHIRLINGWEVFGEEVHFNMVDNTGSCAETELVELRRLNDPMVYMTGRSVLWGWGEETGTLQEDKVP